MRLSVIVSTYNQPNWLELVLWGLSVQTDRDFELLIADDGSNACTREVLQRFREATTLGPRHVWQEDQGFRKCTILNRAIAQATGDYLIFLDGDCVPRQDFVQQHAVLAERGRFLSGGAVRLPRDLSHGITPHDVVNGRAHDWRWLRVRGMPMSRDVFKLVGKPVSFGRLLDAVTSTRATFNGGNASAWKDDLLRVNGFDERMGYGGLDRELGERLTRAGVRGKRVRHRGVCVHLDHPRTYANAAVREFNDRIRRQTRTSQSTWTPHGIVKSDARAA